MPRVLPLLVPAVALGMLVAGQTALPASAATDQRYPVPRTGQVTIAGHGYGHGHGMSQHGAQGAAKTGMGWEEIVAFYYPGTEVGRSRKRVRVLISADTTDDVVVGARSGLKVRDTGRRQTWLLPDNGATLWRLRVNRRGRDILQYRADRWRRYARLEGDGFFTAGGRPMTLHTPTGTPRYRGRLLAATPSPGSTARDTVNAVAMDTYLRGVVPREIPASWEPDAVRAQAVAARTYASYERAHPRARHYHFCDTTSCQVYGGADAEHPASDAAVADTRRVILTYDGEPAFTQFSASSGGWTAANQPERFPYLRAQSDPYDDWKGNSSHTWQMDVDVARLERTFGIDNLAEIRITDRDGNGEWGGRVNRLELHGAGGKVVRVSGDTMRFSLGLRSRWFTLR